MGEKMMPIEVHLEKRIITNNVVLETDSRSHRDYIVVTALAAVFLFGLLAYAWQHYRWIQYGYRIEEAQKKKEQLAEICLLYTSDAADERSSVDLGGRRI